MRRGLMRDVRDAFDGAICMVGGTFPPEEMAAERARLRAVRREVLGHLRELGQLHKAIARPRTFFLNEQHELPRGKKGRRGRRS